MFIEIKRILLLRFLLLPNPKELSLKIRKSFEINSLDFLNIWSPFFQSVNGKGHWLFIRLFKFRKLVYINTTQHINLKANTFYLILLSTILEMLKGYYDWIWILDGAIIRHPCFIAVWSYVK